VVVSALFGPSSQPEHLPLPENPPTVDADNEGLYTSTAMREVLDELIRPKLFEWVSYIAEHYLQRRDLIATESELIRLGESNAVGFGYVGVPA
jgi:hypothetical protein